MAVHSWTTLRTVEACLLATTAASALTVYPCTPAAIILCSFLVTAYLKRPTQISDPRVRRCEDGIGLACGACLPLALLPTLSSSSRFAALAVSCTVVTTAWWKRRRAVLALFFYACVCSTQSVANPRIVSYALLSGTVPFMTDAHLRAYPRTFTVCESALVSGAIAGVLMLAGDRLVTQEASIDAVTNAALVGALLLWLGVGDCKQTPKASMTRRVLVVFSCVCVTYMYAFRIMGTEPVVWVMHYIMADVKRWGLFLGWVAMLCFAIVVLRPEQKVERVVARKYYHVLGLVIFCSGIAYDEGLTRLGSAVGLCLMLLAEMGRMAGSPQVRKVVDEYAGRLVDERDGGTVVVTHMYLLVGCAGPLWVGGNSAFKAGGLVVVCCMDAIAAAVGRRWGRTRWPGTLRTVEGSVGGIGGAVAFAKALGGGKEVVVATFAAGVVEGVTGQIDNLVLPMVYCSIIGILS